MELVRFYAAIVKIALALAMIGCLKTCTLEMLGLAAAKSGSGMVSYVQFTKALTNRKGP